MTTFLFALAEDFSSRLIEVKAIIARAEKAFEKDEELYDILCRAGSVMIVSGLEAFIKDIQEAIQSDINANIASFADMPSAMQKEFAYKIAYLEGASDSDVQKRAHQIAKFFRVHSVKIDMSAFPYKESTNKNPAANFVDNVFVKYGISSILYSLRGTKFENVFDGNSATTDVLRRKIKRLRSTLYKFPYRELPDTFAVTDWAGKKKPAEDSTLWHDFLGHILRRRHSVVHADARDNPTSWEGLRSDAEKLEILLAGITFAASSLLGADLRS